ncbi:MULTISPECIES: flavodoxin domain-containing protein [unclassified Butyrivibrio]|uniref:flavodoxin family protein n=1 Tax=unclassified Butyrivibrio TaxID=2639466 RepID=UPI0008807DAD|nr:MULTISPECIES: flavodoxin domain-containing protein [unclassified Butyrivibrio]SDB64230.1 Flavodoxin [Butyrivibrio sp. INlla16]SEM12997.1 Flavodoxin [Butyrivibrio sp. ob235]
MSTAVRYYSRSGNTKKVAEYIAETAGVDAVSVDSNNAELSDKVDVLFIGGALYAYGIDENLKQYLKTLSGDKVGKAVVFSTSWLSKHALDLIKDALTDKGIKVESDTLYFKSKAVDGCRDEAVKFAKKYI